MEERGGLVGFGSGGLLGELGGVREVNTAAGTFAPNTAIIRNPSWAVDDLGDIDHKGLVRSASADGTDEFDLFGWFWRRLGAAPVSSFCLCPLPPHLFLCFCFTNPHCRECFYWHLVPSFPRDRLYLLVSNI